MKRVAGIIGLIVVFSSSLAQVHVSRLIIKANQKYLFDQTDIVVADTLIMEDSATIVLNPLKRENYLHTKVMIIGKHCTIQGSGLKGSGGRAGRAGNSPVGPCKSATKGTAGGRGLDGTSGVNLFLYLDKVTMKTPLIIDLHGGDGGDGGKGGEGGSGTSGTVHCIGGDGGLGGNAGNGANGGAGGSITVHCPATQKTFLEENLSIKNYGGRYGKGGRGGYPGSAGLSPKKNGKPGMPGAEGLDGGLGKNGTFTIVEN